MKPLRYAVSLIWGEGFHHFLCYGSELEAMLKIAVSTQKMQDSRRAAKKHKGAKPTVHVWEKKL